MPAPWLANAQGGPFNMRGASLNPCRCDSLVDGKWHLTVRCVHTRVCTIVCTGSCTVNLPETQR
jgi:hypothetical protein